MSIKLSKEHGFNPTILKCPCCGNEMGLALLGRLKGDKKAPMYSYNNELCDNCKKTHVLVVEVKDDKSDVTGNCIAVPKEAINIDCHGSVAFMLQTDFKETFNK